MLKENNFIWGSNFTFIRSQIILQRSEFFHESNFNSKDLKRFKSSICFKSPSGLGLKPGPKPKDLEYLENFENLNLLNLLNLQNILNPLGLSLRHDRNPNNWEGLEYLNLLNLFCIKLCICFFERVRIPSTISVSAEAMMC